MTSLVEKGLSDFLNEELAATMVIEAASATPLPDLEAHVVVKCARVPHVAGPEGAGGIYDAQVEIKICTPGQAPGITEANHRTLCSTVQGKIVEANRAEISETMEEVASMKVQGWYFVEPEDEHGGGWWKTALRYVVGLEAV